MQTRPNAFAMPSLFLKPMMSKEALENLDSQLP